MLKEYTTSNYFKSMNRSLYEPVIQDLINNEIDYSDLTHIEKLEMLSFQLDLELFPLYHDDRNIWVYDSLESAMWKIDEAMFNMFVVDEFIESN